MKAGRWQEIERVFGEALEIDRESREAFVRAQADGDSELVAEVLSLLEAHGSEDRRLDGHVEQRDAIEAILSEEQASVEPARPANVPAHIGSYEIDAEIASGGMGTVYRAHRVDGEFHQEVAIKLIRRDAPGKDLLERFRREREALARLEHPNIARLIDGGSTESGEPYLVMEYIGGSRLDEYADEKVLTLDARVELFLQICSAVEYAHRNLIVHRDIKPGNVLVTPEGLPKLLDFGIVKILSDDDASNAVTQTGLRAFTPRYASPEQLLGEPISTASDVYSLGVLLHELLTGQVPYESTGSGPEALMRAIMTEDPVRPSTLFRRAQSDVDSTRLEQLAQRRRSRPDRLRRRLAGDLDNILLMALAREPERRYPSVGDLADDLRRQRDGLPIRARTPTLRYRTLKFLRRNRSGVVIAAALALVVFLGSWFLVREAQLARSEQASRELASSVQRVLASVSASRFSSGGIREGLRSALEGAHIERVARSLESQPRDLVEFSETIAGICEDVHDFESAVDWRRRVVEAAPADEAPEARKRLGIALRGAGQLEDSERTLWRAQQMASRRGRVLLANEILRERARTAWEEGRLTDCEALLEEGLGALGFDRSERTLEARLRLDRAELRAWRHQVTGAHEDLDRVVELARRESIDDADLLWGEADVRRGLLLWRTPAFAECEVWIRRGVQRMLEHLPLEDERALWAMSRLVTGGRIFDRPSQSHLWAMSQIVSGGRIFDRPSQAQSRVGLWTQAAELRARLFGRMGVDYADSLVQMAALNGLIEGRHLSQAQRILSAARPATSPRLQESRYVAAAVDCWSAVPDIRQEARALLELLDLDETVSSDHWLLPYLRSIQLTLAIRDGEPGQYVALGESLAELSRHLGPRHPDVQALVIETPPTGPPEIPWPPAALAEAQRGRSWPWGRVWRDDDDSPDAEGEIDFEDDIAEKTILVSSPLEEGGIALFWILGRPTTIQRTERAESCEFLLYVNHNPAQVIPFNAARRFVYLKETLQWVPFEIPFDWLREGENTFTLIEAHDPEWKDNKPWEYGRLTLAIDKTRDFDRSWWVGTMHACCLEQQLVNAPKPIDPFSDELLAHRDEGRRECQGELMMFLEILPAR